MATPEAEEFGALLKKLKGRSGLSYGALAGKLHVSTSTLHRYCNGDAVPNEFAPVERLGRLCSASPDELMELHRRWIVADAARRRPGPAPVPAPAPPSSPASSDAAVPSPAPAPPSAPAPVPASADGSAPGGGGEAGAVSGPVSGPASEGVPGADTGRADARRGDDGSGGDGGGDAGHGEGDGGTAASASGSAGVAASASASTVVADLGTGAGAEAGAAGRSRWLRSSRRTRVLLAAAAVVALTVPTTLLVGRLSHGDDSALSKAPAVVDAWGAGVPVQPGRASASGTASPGTPGPPADPSGSGPARTPSSEPMASPGRRAGSEAGSGARAPGGVPLTAAISSYNWEAPCDEYYVLNQAPEDVPPPPTPMDGRSWARALGAVDGAHQLIELTVQGTSREPVVLNALHVRQVSKKAPLPWSVYMTSLGCGSGVTPQSFDIDLDDDRPRTRPVPGQRGDTVVPAKNFPFKVTSTDVEVFDLNVHVEGHEVSWYLELEWSSGGRNGTLRIDDGGKPFRVSAIKTRPQYTYWYDQARWTPN